MLKILQVAIRVMIKAALFIAMFYAIFFLIAAAITVPYFSAMATGWPEWAAVASGVGGLFAFDLLRKLWEAHHGH